MSDPVARRARMLFATVFVIATSGLVYELVAGTLASYVLGDSVRHFSTIIGVYLSSMGLGAYLSRFVKTRLAETFIDVELATALVGGTSAPLLFFLFARARHFEPLLYAEVVIVGCLVGLELPLLMRMLEGDLDFASLVSRVLTFDYAGALVGSVAFALFFVPTLGLVRTSLFFGLTSALVALGSTWVLRDRIAEGARRGLVARGVLLVVLLAVGLAIAPALTRLYESELFGEPIVFARQTEYQRIVLTAGREGRRLYLDGNLQLATEDEYRYHEALVHPVMSAARRRDHVLVLGGGDGLATRELLRHQDVRAITLVELDPAMIDLARGPLAALNGRAFDDPRVRVVVEDAMVFLDRPSERGRYDVIVIDFPDPNNYALGKLYTTWFYRLVARALRDDGALVVQSTSPLLARRSFWCIARTLGAAGLETLPYHVFVPSFGEWGFVLASRAPLRVPRLRPVAGLRYLDDAVLASLFVFGPDIARVDGPVNRLDDQQLVAIYGREWGSVR